MTVSVIPYRGRPELWQQITGLDDEVWPECNTHGEASVRLWPLL